MRYREGTVCPGVRASMSRAPRLLLIGALGSLVACAAPDPEPEPSPSLAAVDTPSSIAHAYTRPSLPTASYEPPATNVVFVAPPRTPHDPPGDGSLASPYASLRDALAFVQRPQTTGPWTIVMRGGIYREGQLDITRDSVTIQRFRSEPVSLYGSVTLTNFQGTGPYTKTLSQSDLPSTDPNFPSYPSYLEENCSALPDHAPSTEGARTAFYVTRAGVPLRRVATTAALHAGEFSYDALTNVLTVKDNPSDIELATKLYALKIRGANVKLAGLDIENYATCVVDWTTTVAGHTYYKAAVMIFRDRRDVSGSTLENSTVANNAASAVAIHSASNVGLTGNVFVNNGWTGAHAADSDGLVVTDNRIAFNNVRRRSTFADAGMKVTNIGAGVVFGNVFEHNAATGFWCDQRCGGDASGARWFVIARNLARYNDGDGLFYEGSHHGVIASNVVHDNGASGIAAFGSRDLRIWNNTAVDNNVLLGDDYHAGISVIDDARCAAGDIVPGGTACTTMNGLVPVPPTSGDHCEPSSGGALANTCNAEAVSIVNNLISGSRSVRPLLNVADNNASLYGAKRIVSSEDFQAYWRSSPNAPQTLINWQPNPGSRAIAYRTLADMRAAANMGADPGSTHYDVHSVEFPSGAIHPFFVDYARKNFVQNPGSPEVWGNGAALPIEVRTAVYWPETSPAQPSPRIGAIEWAQKPAVNTCPLAAPVYHRRHPTTGDRLLTASVREANNGAAMGYTVDHGIAFNAAIVSRAGLVPVFRLFNPSSKLHFWTISAGEKAAAAASFGYTVDEGIAFHASPTTGPCLTGVYRLQSAGNHVYTVSTAERNLLVAAGWVDEGIRFYVGSR
jgi:parallel beta-helix repeat protein